MRKRILVCLLPVAAMALCAIGTASAEEQKGRDMEKHVRQALPPTPPKESTGTVKGPRLQPYKPHPKPKPKEPPPPGK